MTATLATILNILATPPGDLAFHLLVSLALSYMVGFVLKNYWQARKHSQVLTFLVGSGILLFLQLCLFGLRLYYTGTPFQSAYFFHMFERLASTLTIMWLVWMFFDKDDREVPTIYHIILSGALLVLALTSTVVRPRLSLVALINPLTIDLIWQLVTLAMIAIGIMLAVYYRPPLVKNLVIILGTLALGHLLQILLMDEMRWYMGAVRLTQTFSFLWLLRFFKEFLTVREAISYLQIRAENFGYQKEDKSQIQWRNLSSKWAQVKSSLSSWVKSLVSRFSKSRQPETAPESEIIKGPAEMTNNTKPTLVDLLLKINLAQNRDQKFQSVAQALSFSVVADICLLVSMPEEMDRLHIVSGYDLIRETTLKPDTLAREDLPRMMAAWHLQQTLTLSQGDPQVRDAQTLSLLINHHTIGNLLAYPLDLPGNPLAGGVIFLSPYTGKRWDEHAIALMDHIKDTLAAILFTQDTPKQDGQAFTQAQRKINALVEASEKLRKALSEKEIQIRENETTIKGLKAKYQIDKMESVTRIEHMQHTIADLNTRLTSQQDLAAQLEQLQNQNRLLKSEQEQLRLELNRAKSVLQDRQTETGQTGPIRLSLENQVISLDSIAANARLQVAAQLQKNNIDLEIHNPDGRLMIKTDPDLLQRALFELLTNAILASEVGGTIRLEQKLSPEMGMLTIQVTDFGDGLTQAEQTALFSGQYNTISGIGSVPAIRNAIRAIRVLNGKVWLKSKKVSFTTFRFQIPVRIID
ncbi:MAG: ATP-binding protein [Brevefilum sp.]